MGFKKNNMSEQQKISNGVNKLLSVAITVAIVVGGGAFYGGMKYAQGRSPRGNFANLTPEQRQQFMANVSGGFRGGADHGGEGGSGGFRGGSGFTAGEIISKDDKSITVKIQDGGSKIVFYSDTTEVSKFTSGALRDLEVGKTVTVNGQTNSDGSVIAQTIQIRPISTSTPTHQ